MARLKSRHSSPQPDGSTAMALIWPNWRRADSHYRIDHCRNKRGILGRSSATTTGKQEHRNRARNALRRSRKFAQKKLLIHLRHCWTWPKRTGGHMSNCLKFLPRDWNLKPIFTQKWASVDTNWRGGSTLQPLSPAIPTLLLRPLLPYGYSYKASCTRSG